MGPVSRKMEQSKSWDFLPINIPLSLPPRPGTAESRMEGRYGLNVLERPEQAFEKMKQVKFVELIQKIHLHVLNTTTFPPERNRISHALLSIEHDLQQPLKALYESKDSLTGTWHAFQARDHSFLYSQDKDSGAYQLVTILAILAIGAEKQVEEILEVDKSCAKRYARLVPPPKSSETAFYAKIHDECIVINYLKKARVPNIASIRDIAHGDEHMFTMESCSQDLADFITKNYPKTDAEAYEYFSRVYQIILCLAETIEAMHKTNVCHRDIKPSNVLLRRENGLPLLTDFGFAVFSKSQNVVTAGTIGYVAPELFLSFETTRPLPVSDLWSFGVLLYEAIKGENPFLKTQTLLHQAHCKFQQYPTVETGDVVGQVTTQFSKLIARTQSALRIAKDPLEDLIAQLISEHPRSRGTAAEALAIIRNYVAKTDIMSSLD